MTKRAFAAILFFFLLSILCGWFLLVKSNSAGSFETSAAPGVVFQKVTNWQFKNFQDLEMVKKMPFQSIQQKATLKNKPYYLTWRFVSVNDSVSQVNLEIDPVQSSFGDRIKFFFGNEKFQDALEEEMNLLKETLLADNALYTIEIEGNTISPESTCACISLKSAVDEKAFEMMASIDHLSNFVLQHELETTGRPRVIIQKWDFEQNFINFDFCFPVTAKKEPQHPFIFFKKIPAVPSIKATFRGNYMFSDLAWYELQNYAEQNDLQVKSLPQEIFYDNPEMGGDSRNWKAEIFLPLEP